jgi:sulfite exporter TauE/SafE
VVGATLGLIGQTTLGSLESSELLIATAAFVVAAGVLDLSRTAPPGLQRQVNETWIGAFRGWVYGGGFGLQLGSGFLTYIVSWGVFAMFLAEIFTVSPAGGALVGAVFGLGRSSTLLLAGYVDRPSRLTSFNRKLADAGPPVRRLSSVALAALGAATIAVGLL